MILRLILFLLVSTLAVSAQTLAERLGYPAGTKLIVVHADDLGETHAVNAAAIKAIGRFMGTMSVLRERADQRGGYLSGGEQQMLTIARSLTGNPELLLLDEPSEGLAPLVVDTLFAKISELKAQGLTILLAEQRVNFALALADRVYVLEKGTVRFSGPAAELRQDRALLERLLAL